MTRSVLADLPPTGSRFFYLGIDRNENNKLYSSEILMSDTRGSKKSRVLFTTSSGRLDLVTSECSSCDVPAEYKIENTGLGGYADRTTYVLPKLTDYFESSQDNKLDKCEFEANEWSSNISFQWWTYHRETTSRIQFAGISNANPSYKSDSTAGFIGFAPYSSDVDNREVNFMFQLKK